jgi:hypothetical protein
MRTLAPYRKPLAVAQSAIAPEIHQPLDIHCDLPPQVALDGIVAIDNLANAQHVVVCQFVHAPLERNTDPVADLKGLGSADAVDVSEPDRDPLLVRDIDARDARHLHFSSKNDKIGVDLAPRKGGYYTV